MNNIHQKSLIVVVILQMLFFAGWYSYESGQFATPVQTIKVKPLPRDPRDFISGQYLRLQYSFTRAWGRYDPKLKKQVYPEWLGTEIAGSYKNQDIWLVLHDVDGFYEPKKAYTTKPLKLAEGEVVIKGRQKRHTIKYGIERFYVPEGTPEPSRNEMVVELNLYENGKVRIKQAYVNDELWP